MFPIINALIKATALLDDNKKVIKVSPPFLVGQMFTLRYADGHEVRISKSVYDELVAQTKIDLEQAQADAEQAQREFQREQIISPVRADYERIIRELNAAHAEELATERANTEAAFKKGKRAAVKAARHIVPSLIAKAKTTRVVAEMTVMTNAETRLFLDSADKLAKGYMADSDTILESE